MNNRKFNPANLPIDLNTLGAVIGILAVIAAVVGGVVGSGALNDQSGSSRGASMQVITPPSNTNPAPSKPEAEAKPSKPEAETEPSAEAEAKPSTEVETEQDELAKQIEDAWQKIVQDAVDEALANLESLSR